MIGTIENVGELVGDLSGIRGLEGTIENIGGLVGDLSGIGGLEGTMSIPSKIEGTRDYEKLNNKPSIESVILIGNKNFPDLGLSEISTEDLLEILT